MVKSKKHTDESKNDKGRISATQLIRDRIGKLHDKHEHDAEKRSGHQLTLIEKFWHEHGDHPDQAMAWNKFYANLKDHEKHQLWQESQPGYVHGSAESGHGAPTETQTGQIEENIPKATRSKAEAKKKFIDKSKQAKGFASKNKTHLKPIFTAIIVIVIVLTLNYNEVVVAQVRQYVTPGADNNSPVIIDPNAEVKIGKEPRIIIPKINVDVPVVYDVTTYDEDAIQAGLERGVVHYGDTPLPGEAGNNVIVGHSSNNFFNSGKYKFAFVLLDRLEINDTFILHYEGTRYIYKVYNKVVVEPNDFSVIQPTNKPTTTLITCTPPGTSWRRLAIQAEQISPVPGENQSKAPSGRIDPGEAEVVPGNSQSLFDRFWNAIF